MLKPRKHTTRCKSVDVNETALMPMRLGNIILSDDRTQTYTFYCCVRRLMYFKEWVGTPRRSGVWLVPNV